MPAEPPSVQKPDYFALFGEPRSPWLDPESLKQKFMQLCSETHPDRIHNAASAEKAEAQSKFTQLNTAYNCLRNPRLRVQHLIELETGTRPAQIESVPPALTDLFFKIGKVIREADQLVHRKEAASPLLKVEVFANSQACVDQLSAIHQDLSRNTETLNQRLQQLSGQWDSAARDSAMHQRLVAELADLYRTFAYYDRWNAQLREKLLALAP